MGSYLCPQCEAATTFFTYPLCPGCGRTVSHPTTHLYCRKRTNLDGLYALSHYHGPLRQLITSIKYTGQFDKVTVAGKLLVEHLPTALRHTDLIVPIPLHSRRLKERGFNQSELIAKQLSNQIRIPCANLLKRQRYTPAQAGLPRQQRLTNIKAAFCLNPKMQINNPPQSLLLVDDVATTFTTLNEAARALKQSFPCKIYGVVLAHGK